MAHCGAVQEDEALRARVKSLEQEAPLRRIDPSMIRPSRWANRHEASFLTAEFQELTAEIAAAGRNVQPIKVRPVQVLNGSTPPDELGWRSRSIWTDTLSRPARTIRTGQLPGRVWSRRGREDQ